MIKLTAKSHTAVVLSDAQIFGVTTVEPLITANNSVAELSVVMSGFGEDRQPDPRKAKYIPDSALATESSVATAIKAALDSLAAEDTPLFGVETVQRDGALSADSFDRVVNYIRDVSNEYWRYTSERYTAPDFALIETASFQFSTTKSDSATLQDASEKSVDKLSADLSVSTDQLAFSSVKLFVDTAQTTDDVLGEALADDDQTATFQKVINEAALPAETYSISINVISEDASIVNDVFALAPSKMHTEVLSANEAFSYVSLFNLDLATSAYLSGYTDKPYANEFAILEALSVSQQRPFSDLTTSIDSCATSLLKPFTEASVSADMSFFSIAPLKVDSIAMEERFERAVGTIRSDTSTTSDTSEFYISGYFSQPYTQQRYVGVVYTT